MREKFSLSIEIMSEVKKMLRSNLKLPFLKEGRNGSEEGANSPNVNEEYKEAFRTKSYIEICNKVQDQLEVITSLDEGKILSSSSPSSPSSLTKPDIHLSMYLFEPREENLVTMSNDTSNDLHQHLVNYYEISQEASKICESLLTNVHQFYIDYRLIQQVINLIKQESNQKNWTHTQYHAVYKNLASFASRANPFSKTTSEKFQELQDRHVVLLHELTSQRRNMKRKTKFVKFMKRVFTTFLIVGFGALIIASFVFLVHTMMGLVAALGVTICSLGIFMMKKMKRDKDKCNKISWLEGQSARLDIAARGVYILINDFDTISRIVQRLKDEMEHRKLVADICVRKGKNEILNEVLKEFQMHESCFLEQVEELEKQVYLCFLDINRSRRLVVQENGQNLLLI